MVFWGCGGFDLDSGWMDGEGGAGAGVSERERGERSGKGREGEGRGFDVYVGGGKGEVRKDSGGGLRLSGIERGIR